MDLADVNAQRLAARQLYNHNGTAAERSRQKELIQLFDSDFRSRANADKNIPQTKISSKIPKTDDVMWDTYLITFESTLLNNLVPKEKGYPLYLRFIARKIRLLSLLLMAIITSVVRMLLGWSFATLVIIAIYKRDDGRVFLGNKAKIQRITFFLRHQIVKQGGFKGYQVSIPHNIIRFGNLL
jgi:hypothetical protein